MLTPVKVTPVGASLNAVREKMRKLGIVPKDVAEAVKWARKSVPLRAVLDTNVLVSALLFGGQPGKLQELWTAKRFVPLVSNETFAEFSKVLAYPKFRLSAAEVPRSSKTSCCHTPRSSMWRSTLAVFVGIRMTTCSSTRLRREMPHILLPAIETCWCYDRSGVLALSR